MRTINYTISTRGARPIVELPTGEWTYYFTKQDLVWLDAGNTPVVDKPGFIALPYGNSHNKEWNAKNYPSIAA